MLHEEGLRQKYSSAVPWCLVLGHSQKAVLAASAKPFLPQHIPGLWGCQPGLLPWNRAVEGGGGQHFLYYQVLELGPPPTQWVGSRCLYPKSLPQGPYFKVPPSGPRTLTFSLCPRIWASGLGSPPSHPHQWPLLSNSSYALARGAEQGATGAHCTLECVSLLFPQPGSGPCRLQWEDFAL